MSTPRQKVIPYHRQSHMSVVYKAINTMEEAH